MFLSLFLGVLLLSNLAYDAQAKVFTKCGLAQELVRLGIAKTFVGNWVCLIEAESGRDTSKEVIKANGGKGLGLFQINSKDWCTFGKPGGKCNAKCEDFLDEELTKDAACAKKIESLLGFRNWEGWTRSCYNREYPSTIVHLCFPSAG
ncbi:lysozyme-like [Diorhabda sublineata]|uniref:lysozyme-like n=1 Tax=Diorhabda sublineata TaxID=1163346 RepID=UPI0024E14E26|nr:lysozyme-like [Diorhabda sublineata]